MAQKIIFFTAGAKPTGPEQTAINGINALTIPAYEVAVRRGDGVGSISYGAGPEQTDFVMGTPPDEYDGVPVFDPEAP